VIDRTNAPFFDWEISDPVRSLAQMSPAFSNPNSMWPDGPTADTMSGDLSIVLKHMLSDRLAPDKARRQFLLAFGYGLDE
jgi:hypothetical protein